MNGHSITFRDADDNVPRYVHGVSTETFQLFQDYHVATLAEVELAERVAETERTVSLALGKAGQLRDQARQMPGATSQQAEAALAQARARLGLSPEGADDRVDIEKTGTVRQAQALLDDSKLKLERAQNLFQRGVLPKAQLDGSEADYKVAQSRYQDAVEEIRNRQALVVQRRSELEILTITAKTTGDSVGH